MSEIIEMNPAAETEAKPYTFRKLSSVDVFPMFKIIGAIGINEFTACFEHDAVKNMIASAKGESGGESMASIVGISVILEIANVILGNIGKCEHEIYQLLSQTSNLTVKQVKELDMAVFFEMVIDFVKKEEFKDFIKVVSKLFK
jgi:hypothetical protein